MAKRKPRIKWSGSFFDFIGDKLRVPSPGLLTVHEGSVYSFDFHTSSDENLLFAIDKIYDESRAVLKTYLGDEWQDRYPLILLNPTAFLTDRRPPSEVEDRSYPGAPLDEDDWVYELRDRISDNQTAELLDAVYVQLHLAQITAVTSTRCLTTLEADLIWHSLWLGRSWRDMTLRNRETQAAAGIRSQAGAAAGGSLRKKPAEVMMAEATVYSHDLRQLRRTKPHFGFVDATDAVGVLRSVSGRIVRNRLKLLSITGANF